MKKRQYVIGLAFGLVAAFIACQPDNTDLPYESDTLQLPSTPYDYSMPPRGTSGLYLSENPNNPISNDGAALGRVLFYDKKLSLNNSVSCASCHKQSQAFADVNAQSVGFQGAVTPRNSAHLVNLASQKHFFWDNRANSLEELASEPIRNHVEMGITELDKLVPKLEKINYYKPLFKAAFGTEDITPQRISNALAQFMRSMVSYQSKYDDFVNKGTPLSPLEREGMVLFMEKLHCANCHGGASFNEATLHEASSNIGLDLVYKDNGIGQLLGRNDKNGLFKVPSLRNVALTAPYMHDGRFKTLDEVINHYDHGVKMHENLNQGLRFFAWEGNTGNPNTGGSQGWGDPNAGGNSFLNLTPHQKEALKSFLVTLTDTKFIADPRFSSPFKTQ